MKTDFLRSYYAKVKNFFLFFFDKYSNGFCFSFHFSACSESVLLTWAALIFCYKTYNLILKCKADHFHLSFHLSWSLHQCALTLSIYHKTPKYLDTQKLAVLS